jgi:hypothetical protein
MRPGGPRSGLSAMAVRTVSACTELVTTSSLFLVGFVRKPAGFTLEPTCNGSRPPPYIDVGVRPIEPPQSIQSIVLIIFTLCIRSNHSLVFLYLEYWPLFGSTSTRGVLGGLSTPRDTIGSLLLDGVSLRRRDLGLMQRIRPSMPSRTVRAPGAGRPDAHREGAAPATRSQTIRAAAGSTDRWFISQWLASRSTPTWCYTLGLFRFFQFHVNWSL